MKQIYIAHPISGDISGNIQKVLAIFRDLALTPDIVPHAPYIVALQALDDKNPKEREAGMNINFDLIKSGIIQEIWLYGDAVSNGMIQEINFARNLNIPIIPHSKETYYAYLFYQFNNMNKEYLAKHPDQHNPLMVWKPQECRHHIGLLNRCIYCDKILQ